MTPRCAGGRARPRPRAPHGIVTPRQRRVVQAIGAPPSHGERRIARVRRLADVGPDLRERSSGGHCPAPSRDRWPVRIQFAVFVAWRKVRGQETTCQAKNQKQRLTPRSRRDPAKPPARRAGDEVVAPGIRGGDAARGDSHAFRGRPLVVPEPVVLAGAGRVRPRATRARRGREGGVQGLFRTPSR